MEAAYLGVGIVADRKRRQIGPGIVIVVEPLEEFASLAQQGVIPLDRAMLAIAAHARPSLDIETSLDALDALATQCEAATAEEVCRVLFSKELFSGNTQTYYDPRNSYLDQVLSRKIGIPISLAALAIIVASRLDVELHAVGLPGHVVLHDPVDLELPYIDVFAGGVRLHEEGVMVLYSRHNRGAEFDRRFLTPLPTQALLFRVLNNLKLIFMQRRDHTGRRTMLEYQVALPGIPPAVRRELADVLATAGQYGAAARQLERITPIASERSEHAASIDRLWARLN